jgi:DNA-binding transcriptional MocR family regulator
MPELVRVKMLTGLTTSEVNERAVYDAVSSRAYRKQVERLVLQLDDARELALERLGDAGLVPLARPRGGMFVSAGWPAQKQSGRAIAERALRAGLLLSPGEFFSLRAPAAPWFRFNVAYAHEPALLNFLRSIRGDLP